MIDTLQKSVSMLYFHLVIPIQYPMKVFYQVLASSILADLDSQWKSKSASICTECPSTFCWDGLRRLPGLLCRNSTEYRLKAKLGPWGPLAFCSVCTQWSFGKAGSLRSPSRQNVDEKRLYQSRLAWAQDCLIRSAETSDGCEWNV